MAPQSFLVKWKSVLGKLLAEKSAQGDDLDWEEWNNRGEYVVGKRWSGEKLVRYKELFKLGNTCVVRPGGKVIAVECNEHDIDIREYIREELQRSSGRRCTFCLDNRAFNYLPTGSVKFVSLQAYHAALHELGRNETRYFTNPVDPRFILDIGECQTLPELLSYKDEYFNIPGSKVEIFLALKLYLKSEMRRMVAVVFRRLEDGSVSRGEAISFGEEALDPVTVTWLQGQGIPLRGVGHGGEECDRVGVYELLFSTVAVLAGGPMDAEAIRNLCGEFFTCDLFTIKLMFRRGN